MKLLSLLLLAGVALAEPARVIFDTDMAEDCDDTGALAVLHALADRGEAEILAVVTNSIDPSHATEAACSAINVYHGRPTIITGPELQKTAPHNPVRRAFELRMHHGAPALAHGKPSHDQAAVQLAVRGPQPELWDIIDKGRVVFDSDGYYQWARDWPKAHRYFKIKGSPKTLAGIIGEPMSNTPKHHP